MNSRNFRSVHTIFVLLIFCLFAVCSLFLVLIGANGYRQIVREMDSNNETRATLSYVSNKVHAADSRDVSVESINEQQTLVIQSDFNGKEYRTYIYLHDGYLMEFFTNAENEFSAGSGDKITPVSSFTMEKSGNQLSLSVSGQNSRSLSLSLSLT
nr:DUF4860 domain-containing protein [uncultured Caproiciproducens sp.]